MLALGKKCKGALEGTPVLSGQDGGLCVLKKVCKCEERVSECALSKAEAKRKDYTGSDNTPSIIKGGAEARKKGRKEARPQPCDYADKEKRSECPLVILRHTCLEMCASADSEAFWMIRV